MSVSTNQWKDVSVLMKQWDGMLWHAARDGNMERAREALAHGADVNVAPRGGAPLHSAALRGDIEFCRLLLDAGADVNRLSTDSRGNTPVHGLLENYYSLLEPSGSLQLESMALLLEHGADPNRMSAGEGATPLHLAAYIDGSGAAEAIRLLARYDANPNIVSKHGLMPLHGAARSKGFGLRSVQALLAIGADPGFVPGDAPMTYLTPFQAALRRGYEAIVDCYIKDAGQSLDQLTRDGRTLSEMVSGSDVGRALLLSLQTARAMEFGDASAHGDVPPTKRPADCMAL